MIARLLLLLCLAAGPAAAGETALIVYLGVRDDARYAPRPVYTGLSLRDIERPLDGIRLGFRDTRIFRRTLGVSFELSEQLLDPGAAAAPAIRAAKQDGALAVLLDLPADLLAPALAEEGGDGLLINIRDGAARWRGANCAPALLHTAPSDAMKSDALAQYLRAQGWRDVLLLHGKTPEDLELLGTARRAAEKFGLTIAATRVFALTNDPRRRDSSNIALLTGGTKHDVVWLIDNDGEFGRYVPFATYAPRPVVGSEGLTPRAWHWTFERYGAPQLNQRFRRLAGRNMTSEDWAAWAAVRVIVTAVTRVQSADPEIVRQEIRSQALTVDLYKGARGSFRDWNGQLRQPILLTTHNAVIAVAPIEGFDHQVNWLDTLGPDRPENTCRY